MLKLAIRLIEDERIQITAVVVLTRSECDTRMHTCQLSRISRKTLGFVLNVTLSRQRSRMSCIFSSSLAMKQIIKQHRGTSRPVDPVCEHFSREPSCVVYYEADLKTLVFTGRKPRDRSRCIANLKRLLALTDRSFVRRLRVGSDNDSGCQDVSTLPSIVDNGTLIVVWF